MVRRTLYFFPSDHFFPNTGPRLPSERLEAAVYLRAASGGFTTAIHAVLWAENEEEIFRKYGLNVEYLALNTGRLGMQKFYRF